jgi:acyl-CoA synthetase (AMP-forming)/AMP-acid ligase II
MKPLSARMQSSSQMRPLSARMLHVLTLDPAATALSFEGRDYPWSYLRKAVDALEGAGPRVGIVLRNRPAHFAALVAVVATGREVITLSPYLGDEALAQDAGAAAPDAVVADAADLARLGTLDATVLETRTGDEPLRLVASHPPTSTVDSDVAVSMLTSGTTGRPKRVPLLYTKLTAAFNVGGFAVEPVDDVRLRATPEILWTSLVHISGLYFAIGHVATGRRTVLMERFEPIGWAAVVRAVRPRRVGLPPAAIRMLLQSDLPADVLDGVLAVSTGTAALDPEDGDRFTERFGVPVLPVYGATEFAGAIAGWDLPLHAEWGKAKRGSSGRPRPGVELRITDPSTGAELGTGAVGVLEARGDQLPGDGWITTTDLATVDADGFLFIHGRTDDAINRGGFTIVPAVIEDALRDHPAVQDAAAVGLPDVRLGEVPVAAVSLHAGAVATGAELRDWLAGRLARYQLPTRVAVVQELPRTPSMKVSRPAVRALFS